MAHIVFFSIPAHGHTNPTLPVMRELTRRGHRVSAYNAEIFRESIEQTGAQFFPIDGFLPPAPPRLSRRVKADFSLLIDMATDTTLAMQAQIARHFAADPPDAAVVDSLCIWGKLLCARHGVPLVCSTTSFAFNAHTARLMKPKPLEILCMLRGMPRINRQLARLRAQGYAAPDMVSLIQNDARTPTIVYTSRAFQPMSDTFGENYAFVGPCVMRRPARAAHARPLAYISLGTVVSDAPAFYRSCISALKSMDVDAVISVGTTVDIAALGPLPENVRVFPRVNQMEILAGTDVFLTHCGMNSVSESLLCGVPMALFPHTSEQGAVADRVQALGAGLRLRKATPRGIRRALESVLAQESFHQAAQQIAADFAACGGASQAADFVTAHILPT